MIIHFGGIFLVFLLNFLPKNIFIEGWFLSLSSMLCIPIYAIYAWIVTEGTVSEVCFF